MIGIRKGISMNKKIIALIIVLLLVLGGGLFMFFKSDDKKLNDLENNQEQQNNKENIHKSDNSIVLYFSATGTTENIANYISEAINSNIIEIKPLKEYTNDDLNYSNDNSRANIEQNDVSARPQIANDIDINDYDIIYLGYPIWWGTIPKIILTLIENNDFEGKTIIPFCTSGGSGIAKSLEDLKSYNLNVINGKQFGYGSTKEDVLDWLNSLNI